MDETIAGNPEEERYFAALDAFRQRAREALTPVRAELAAWYADFFRRRRGPASATHLVLTVVRGCESARPSLSFNWHPGMHARTPMFTPAGPVPAFVAPDDPRTVGLPAGDHFSLLQLAFQDLAADAWMEAAGTAFPKQLLIVYFELTATDDPPRWVQVVRDQIRRHVSGEVPMGARWGLGPPVTLGIPAVSMDLIDAVRNGQEEAVAKWADAVERAGATDAAELLRWLPVFHALIAPEVQRVSPQFGFAVVANKGGSAWWWIGDLCSESDNDEAHRLGRLTAAWNETHPAVEWLLRRLGCPRVSVEAIHHATDKLVGTQHYDLGAGQHLEPVSAGVRILKLDVPAWEEVSLGEEPRP